MYCFKYLAESPLAYKPFIFKTVIKFIVLKTAHILMLLGLSNALIHF